MDITATVSSLGQVYGHHSNCQFIRTGLWTSQLSVPNVRFMDITATVSSLGQVYGHHSNCQFLRSGLWTSQQLSVHKDRFMDITTVSS